MLPSIPVLLLSVVLTIKKTPDGVLCGCAKSVATIRLITLD